MASEIRVDKINSLSGVGTVTLSPTGVDIAGITTTATLRATTGIVTSLTTVSSAKVGSGVTLSPDGDIFATGVTTATSFSGSGANLTSLPAANLTGTLPAISGANLTSLPAQATIANNADNRVITGGSGVNLNGESKLTFDGDIFSAKNSSGNAGVDFNVSSGTNPRIDFNTANVASSGIIKSEESGSGAIMEFHNKNSSGGEQQVITLKVNRNLQINDGDIELASGHGISFAATADSGGTMANELLDDYEEGTWTPKLAPDSSYASIHENGIGRYTKIGNMVHCTMGWFDKDCTSFPTNEQIMIYNFPFTIVHVGNNADAHYIAPFHMAYNVQFGQQDKHYFYSNHNQTTARGLKTRDGTSWQTWSTADWNQSGLYFDTQMTYMTTS